jgi:hypothetical protein
MRLDQWVKITGGLFWVVLLAACTNHRDPHKSVSNFYVVPTAERYAGFNGHLSWYGRERAGALLGLLRDSAIEKIYVTPYSRTLETADSLRLQRRIDTVVYLVDSTGDDLTARLEQSRDYGRKILIVSDGPQIPVILQRLGADYNQGPLPDSVRNLIFRVVNDHGKVSFNTLSYGPPNQSADTTASPLP